MSIAVCIVDDHNEIRSALEQIILMADDCELVGSCSGLQEALIKIPDLKPNVVLMDMKSQTVMDNSSKVIRISNLNHHRIVSKGHYGDTFDSILTRILDRVEESSRGE